MKLFVTVLFFISVISITSFAEPDHYFAQSGNERASYIENGEQVTNRWVQNIKGNWYYCGSDGYLLKDTWLHDPINGKYYYLGSDWAMLHDTTTPDGYTVGSDGAWVKDGKVVVETVKTITEQTK